MVPSKEFILYKYPKTRGANLLNGSFHLIIMTHVWGDDEMPATTLKFAVKFLNETDNSNIIKNLIMQEKDAFKKPERHKGGTSSDKKDETLVETNNSIISFMVADHL